MYWVSATRLTKRLARSDTGSDAKEVHDEGLAQVPEDDLCKRVMVRVGKVPCRMWKRNVREKADGYVCEDKCTVAVSGRTTTR